MNADNVLNDSPRWPRTAFPLTRLLMPLCALLCAAAPVQAQKNSRLQEPAAREMPASASSPEARDWREAFTPFEDPLRTRPPELDQPLRLELPPDLRSGEAVTDRIDADNVEAFPCAESNLTAALAAEKPVGARSHRIRKARLCFLKGKGKKTRG